MKKISVITLAFITTIIGLRGQEKKKLDREAIKGMCGCFEVTFNFAETFNYSTDSLYKPSKTKVESALEWAQLFVDEDDRIAIQHILQVGPPSQPYIVKHWRQDWLYENTDLYYYNGDNNWTFEKKEPNQVMGQWTQKVFQVDDSPRYEGTATWVHVDGKSYWENTTPAPLPRREFTTRADYNITMRGNRHEITTEGWVHDQDNDKVMRKVGEDDFVLAKEKGYNRYVQVADERCKAAADWWVEHYDKWATVRSKWDEVYARNTNLILKEKVDNKVLYKHLFSDEMVEKDKINNVIESFVVKETPTDSKSK